jgi:hypothetical protein
MWLNRGEQIRWEAPWGLLDHASIEDGGGTLVTAVRFDRVFLIPGLFYGMEGMRVGGMRELRISPHMAYGGEGVEATIPPDAVLRAEVAVLDEIDPAAQPSSTAADRRDG